MESEYRALLEKYWKRERLHNEYNFYKGGKAHEVCWQEWDKADDEWRELPLWQQNLFEGSAYRSTGRRIRFENLTLANICGNIRDDYFQYEGSYLDAHMGPTWKGSMHWLPRRKEIERITVIAESVTDSQELPIVLEIGAGTGLLSFLLANTRRLNVTGMDPAIETFVEKDMVEPYTLSNLELLPGNSKASVMLFEDNSPDVIISSWMPEDIDFTDDIVSLKPKVIIYMYSNADDQRYEKLIKDDDRSFGIRFKPKKGYRRFMSWQGFSGNDVGEFWLYVNSERTSPKYKIYNHDYLDFFKENLIEVHLREDVESFALEDSEPKEKYKWENTDLTTLIDPKTYKKFSRKPNKLKVLKDGIDALMYVDPIQYHI